MNHEMINTLFNVNVNKYCASIFKHFLNGHYQGATDA